MVNYLSRFLPSVTREEQPRHNLLKKDVRWTLTYTQGESFQRINEVMVKSPVLAFFDPGKELTLENDASEYGLWPALIQCGTPGAFASRARSLVEKEMLAVLFGLIVHKHLSKVPRRLQAMLLRTHEYHFTVTYMTGTKILVDDALSHAPVSETPMTELVIVNNLLLSLIVPNRLDEIKGTQARETKQWDY